MHRVTSPGRPQRIGVLGGTFDPPHIGHLAVAVNVRDALGLDLVLLVVANDPWQKRGRHPISPAADRLAMTRAAVEGHVGLEADDREIRRGGPSYSVDTVQELVAERPGAVVFVIVGQDAAAGLPTWDRPEILARLASVAVVARPGSPFGPGDRPCGFRWVAVEAPELAVSSTDLRARVARGRTIEVLTPPGVASYVRDRGLYSVGR